MRFTGERVVPGAMVGDTPERQAQLDRIVAEHMARYRWAAAACAGHTVLDAACGVGYGTKMLRKVAKSAVGVDIDPESITYAGEGFSVCDLETDFPAGEFDVIVSFETIEHLSSPSPFLENCAQACKVFVFSIPLNNLTGFHKVAYSLKEAKALIEQYFKTVTWYEQTLDQITPLTTEGRFLVGFATNMV